jgi:DNA-binding IclR family transcriptional regulator
MTAQSPRDLLAEMKTELVVNESQLSRLVGIPQPTVHRILNNQDGCALKTFRVIEQAHADMKNGTLKVADQTAA